MTSPKQNTKAKPRFCSSELSILRLAYEYETQSNIGGCAHSKVTVQFPKELLSTVAACSMFEGRLTQDRLESFATVSGGSLVSRLRFPFES